MEKKVSVIIPAYNTEKYITRCLESVCRQNYKNLQIIVVDDGSTDNTLQVANKYKKQDNRVIVHHKKNGGVSSARNIAMDFADGDYFFFLDSDDMLEEGAIQTLVEAMEKSDYDWVSCQCSRYDEFGIRLEDYDFFSGEKYFFSDKDRIQFMTKILLNYKMGFEVWNKLYIAEIVRNNNIVFPIDCSIGEDLAFNLKYLIYSKKLNCIPDRPIRYIIRTGSAMDCLDKFSTSVYEHSLILKDVWNYINYIGNEFWIRKFPCVFVKVLDNVYVGHSPLEVSAALKGIGDISFIKEKYRDIDACKNEIIKMYSPELARIKYFFHINVRQLVDEKYSRDKLKLFLYGLYRRARGREPLAYWKMPY